MFGAVAAAGLARYIVRGEDERRRWDEQEAEYVEQLRQERFEQLEDERLEDTTNGSDLNKQSK